MIKTSKLVGWSQHQPTVQPPQPQQHPQPVHWVTQPYTTATPTTTQTTVISSNTTPKEPATNTSLDSGVAGLRDTPVHTPGPLQNNNTNTNNNNMPGPKPVNNNEEYDVPKFIVDQTTRTTYMKGRFLGKGGFARVHELTDLTTNVTYAGKIIPKSRITKPHHKEKIAREIEVHRQLYHQHVVRFHKYFEDDSNVYIILENCSMRSLVHVVKYRRTLTEPEVRYYVRQLAEGVAYIHGAGIIHRDLKLGNMFLSHDMQVKIGDFGLATRTADTRQVTICGTPNYIAPEVLNKFGHYYQADIWAIGCIMYALLVGQPPFETETLKETYSRITNNQYVIPPLVSSQGRALITELLHPEPKSRPTVDELLRHDFFTQGFIPHSLPTTACTQVPKFGLEGVGKSVSMPEHYSQQQQHSQVISQDINKITTSVSTLRLPNLKPQQDKNTNCLGGLVSPTRKRDVTSGTLYNLLATCLDSMPDGVSNNPPSLTYCPLFISKWIDYSNKYGFGYQLSDHSVGIFFNDLTRINSSADKSRIEFHDSSGRLTVTSPASLPAWLQERYQLLLFFAGYMDENLTEAGDSSSCGSTNTSASSTSNNSSTSSTGSTGCGGSGGSGSNSVKGNGGGSNNTTGGTIMQTIPHVRRWDRTPKSIIMHLSNGTFQINFFKDHTKIVVSGERSADEACLLYIASDGVSSSYRLTQVASVGCDAAIRERLVYALSCLRQYAEMDGEEV